VTPTRKPGNPFFRTFIVDVVIGTGNTVYGLYAYYHDPASTQKGDAIWLFLAAIWFAFAARDRVRANKAQPLLDAAWEKVLADRKIAEIQAANKTEQNSTEASSLSEEPKPKE
jgi:hypothetical protein